MNKKELIAEDIKDIINSHNGQNLPYAIANYIADEINEVKREADNG